MPVDPQIQSILDMMAAAGAPPMASGTPERARAGFHLMTAGLRDPATLAPVRSTEDVTFPAPAGPRPARIYRPDIDGAVPTVLFIHGGGYVIGDIDTHEDHARMMCERVGAVVYSIDYRLAPEHPFPAAPEDSRAALEHVFAIIDQLGGDRSRVAVAGDSAGGNLSAGVAIAARDLGLPLRAQLLLYPSVDFREDGDYPSRVENAEGKFLTADDMLWFRDQYLTGSTADDPRGSVITADLPGVAPAIVATAEYDPLRDEGEAYAAALEKAGVPVVLNRYAGMIHGFFGLGVHSDAAAKAVDEICRDLKDLLA